MTDSNKLDISLISAGAGSGKTYRLTGEMTKLLQSGVRASGIIATTFTKKAAAELQERVRVRLLEAGLSHAANDLGSALIGTVHSIGVKLLQRFAFEAGVSPLVEIIADGDEQRLFNESMSQVLTEERIERFNLLADRLGFTKKTSDEAAFDWRKTIRELTDVARANNFGLEVLKKSKELSWESFERFLPEVKPINQQTWNNRLGFFIEQTIANLENNEADSTKTTKEVIINLRNFSNQLKWRGELHWHEWVKISKLAPGAKSRELFEELKEFALSHDESQQFRDDVKGYVDLVFEVAVDALQEFEQYKKKRGLIDYTDMETYVSQLLKVESVRETIREELDLLLVDEFQDTSPIQLDIFLQLSRLAKHCIWVGDPKQSIYGFRGADPAMMKAIVEHTGGVKPDNILDKSWRSREDLVNAVNAIFVKAFPEYPAPQIALEAQRTKDKEPKDTPLGLLHWRFKSDVDEKKVPGSPWFENCIAKQISVLIERKLPVQPKGSKEWRPVQAGDIAVLCRSNGACVKIAESLHKAGLKASIARFGLLETPEAKLILACLKWLLTPSDSLSMAEIRFLASGEPLEQIVDDRLAYLERLREAVPDSPKSERWGADNPILRSLAELRPRTADLSASEILNMLLDELDLRRTVVTFGNAPQRLDNVDMLRSYALDYESACTRLHSAASLGGFLLWLSNLSNDKKDLQGSGESPEAVKVLTYHKSKGLEYPVTVCFNLDNQLKENIWGLNLVSEKPEIDINNILGNRWLRFWVNPYNDQIGKTRLEENLQQSPEWAAASANALAEEARLLYVGLTRARDYIVFPSTSKPTKWLNRVFNKGDEDIPTLDPYSDETPFYWNNKVLNINTEEIFMPKDFPTAENEELPVLFHAERSGKKEHLLYRIDPYSEIPSGPEPTIGEPCVFAPALDTEGLHDDQLSDLRKALYSVFLADNLKYPNEERLKLAQKQLEIRQIKAEVLAPLPVMAHSAAFLEWVKKQFSPKKLTRKMPVKTFLYDRLLDVEIDFFLENDTEIAIVQCAAASADAKKSLRNQAQHLSSLFVWLKMALKQSYPSKKMHFWVVFPMDGQAIEVEV